MCGERNNNNNVSIFFQIIKWSKYYFIAIHNSWWHYGKYVRHVDQ